MIHHFLSDWEIQKLQTANICYDSSLIRDVDQMILTILHSNLKLCFIKNLLLLTSIYTLKFLDLYIFSMP